MHVMHVTLCLACKPHATFSTYTGSLTLFHAAASIGFTRRVGNTRLVHASLSQLLQAFPNTLPDPATTARDSSWASERRVALVFGREESGLTANELSLCTHSCSIPTGPVQPSLNLSHAVCVILAQLFEQRTSNTDAGVRSVHFTQLAYLCSCIAAKIFIACMGTCHYQAVVLLNLIFTVSALQSVLTECSVGVAHHSHKLLDTMHPLRCAVCAAMLPYVIVLKSSTCLSRRSSKTDCNFKTTSGCVATDVATVKQVPKQHQPAPRSDVEFLINRWTELTDAAGLGYVAAEQTLL